MTDEKPWWAQPGADVSIGIIKESATCPVCGAVDDSGAIELRFPKPKGFLLGMILHCGCVLDAREWDLAVSLEEGEEGFFQTAVHSAGQMPVTIVDQSTGKADMIPLRVIDAQ